jgi:hypothetical protein
LGLTCAPGDRVTLDEDLEADRRFVLPERGRNKCSWVAAPHVGVSVLGGRRGSTARGDDGGRADGGLCVGVEAGAVAIAEEGKEGVHGWQGVGVDRDGGDGSAVSPSGGRYNRRRVGRRRCSHTDPELRDPWRLPTRRLACVEAPSSITVLGVERCCPTCPSCKCWTKTPFAVYSSWSARPGAGRLVRVAGGAGNSVRAVGGASRLVVVPRVVPGGHVEVVDGRVHSSEFVEQKRRD